MNIAFILFVTVISLIGISGGDSVCKEFGVLLYETIGCKPIKSKPSDKCPSSFNCDHLYEKGNFCLFQGKKINVGGSTPSSGSCNGPCRCMDQLDFSCPEFDCPEFIEGIPDKCYLTYEIDHCCASGHMCPPFDRIASCTVDGKLYREGQMFSPKDSCQKCICKKGFKGEFVKPFCKVPSCDLEVRHSKDIRNNCAPIYDNPNARCCPYLWLCPNKSHVFIHDGKIQETKVCQFGSEKIKSGYTLKTTYEQYGKRYNLTCDCQLPPLLTCLVESSSWIK